jgi:hypothetical protein
MRPSRNEFGNKTAGGYPPPRDRDAEDPLQSAAGFILRSTQAMRDRHVGRRELFDSEAQALFAWGQDRSLILDQELLAQLRPVSSGAEHEVFLTPGDKRR